MKSKVGALVLLAGLVVLAGHGAVVDAAYTGQKMCIVCHGLKHKPITTAFPKTAHARAMLEATDATIVADFTNAPFEKAKAAYVLGSGRHEQAYLTADLKVLPGLWLVGEKKWIPHEEVDGATECVGCHTVDFDPATKKWKQLGVGCESCHGPGGQHNMAKAEDRKTTILNPKELEPQLQAQACGQCHSRGRSKDGQTAFPHKYRPGTDLTAVFVDAKPTTPGRNQQLSELMQSPKHWQAGVVCETCHDPHGDTEFPYQLKMAIDDTCLQCHKDKIVSLAAHVADKKVTAPAGATCATCHMPDGVHNFAKKVAKATAH